MSSWNPFASKPSQSEDTAPPAAVGFRFQTGFFLRPHDDKVYKGGEDAFVATESLIAVADGVGGWADHGVDPGLFSKQLCRDIKMLYENNKTKSLKQILCEAVAMNKNTGSSTACLASISENGLMKTTNLGDSGYVIWRP